MNVPKMSAFIAVALLMGCAMIGCSPEQGSKDQQSSGVIQSFLSPYQGKVLLLLMGREGCPGTAKATEFLHTYAATKPEAERGIPDAIRGIDRGQRCEQQGCEDKGYTFIHMIFSLLYSNSTFQEMSLFSWHSRITLT